MTAEISDEPKPSSSRLGRALRVFGDVRGKEAPTAMLMTLNIFVVLVAYYVIKTVREPLILTLGGAALSWPIGLKLRAELRGTECYVAWDPTLKVRLCRLCSYRLAEAADRLP